MDETNISDSGVTQPDAAPTVASDSVEPSAAIPSVEQEDVSSTPDAPDDEAPEGADDEANAQMGEADQEPNVEEVNLWTTLQSNFEEKDLADLAQQLTWAQFRDDNGNPSLESIQILIDGLVDVPGSVLAGDVLAVVDKIQSGDLDPNLFHQEYGPEYQKYRELQQQNYQARRDQEIRGRSAMVQTFTEQQNVMAGMDDLIERCHLGFVDDEPNVSRELKEGLHYSIGNELVRFHQNNPSWQYVRESLEEAARIGGPTLDDLHKDPLFRESLLRGRTELNEAKTKSIGRAMRHYSLAMRGYQAEQKEIEDRKKAEAEAQEKNARSWFQQSPIK